MGFSPFNSYQNNKLIYLNSIGKNYNTLFCRIIMKYWIFTNFQITIKANALFLKIVCNCSSDKLQKLPKLYFLPKLIEKWSKTIETNTSYRIKACVSICTHVISNILITNTFLGFEKETSSTKWIFHVLWNTKFAKHRTK